MRRPATVLLVVGALWATTRMFAVWMLTLLPWVPFDVQLYEGWAQGLMGGSFPVADPRWQYPDLMALPLVAPTALPGTYLTGFVLVALVIDAVTMGLLIWAWRRDHGSVWGLIVWAAAGLWVGPVLLTRLDIFPTLLAMAAVVWAARPILSAALSALGFGLKVWPAATLVALPRGRLVRAALAFVGTVMGAFVVVRLIFPGGESFLGAQASRGLHAESVPALPYVVAALLGHPPTFTETHGTIEVATRWDVILGLGFTVVGLALIVLLAVARWTGRLGRVAAGDVVFLAVLTLVVTGRVFSPQFYVWLAGVGAIALIARESVMRVPVLLVVASAVVAQYVYPLHTGWPIDVDALAAQVVRVLLLVAAFGWALAVLVRRRSSSPSRV